MVNDPLKPERFVRAEIPAAEVPRTDSLLALATGVVIVAGLILAREVLIPLTLAIFLCFFLTPIVDLLQKAKVPKPLGVVVAVTFAFALIASMGFVIGVQISSLAENLPQYQATVISRFSGVQQRLTGISESFDKKLHQGTSSEGNATGSSTSVKQGQQPVPVVIESSSLGTLESARQVIIPVLSPLSTLAIVVIVSIFFLLQQDDLRDRAIRLTGSSDLHRTTEAIKDATRRLTRYFLTQAGVNATFGLVIGIGLFFIGVPSPILWGLFAGLLRFVPYIGSIISAFLPVVLALAVDPGWSKAAWTAGLFVVAEGITGQVLEPLLYGKSSGLSPAAVVVVAIFWSWVWGPIGLILSTPLTLCLAVLGRHVAHLEFFDVMFGDRPAFTPIETFHQRMLAGDLAEVAEQAEELLKSRTLASYYDGVAVEAMRLLGADVYRGAIRAAQLTKIQSDLDELIDDLDRHEDVDPNLTEEQVKEATIEVAGVQRPERGTSPPPAGSDGDAGNSVAPHARRNERSILCIPGEGPFDVAATMMLAQTLLKHGLGAQALSPQEASRYMLRRLTANGVMAICVIYLDLTGGNQPRMRYLVKRVRQTFPGCPILVGLWDMADVTIGNTQVQAMVRADGFASSLLEAQTWCLELAAQPVEQNSAAAIV
jgi:predicted PurR-regulated permease PerM